ncbi:ShlB/FhaC/HecB family hemolysin secretion/activation protein [Herbaspirillum sp. RV1423]|uniref:ShlB/FhaC/HecB family hemolysin secretion/activation protein n=1 Tax=Herbaspirillum sp. RV1423 TaxID=1443993 RepID=UPI0004B3A511|nr:ShlB/FhaC/HecB family hemolysin secretion/activation protein [Herbaspirillum sp. RV1423]
MINKHRAARAAIAPLLLSAAIHNACAQVDDDTQRRARRESQLQQQREQLQQQAEERERLQRAPDGRLPDASSDIYKDTDLPVEARCFVIDQVQLDLPDDLSPAQRRLGASDLSQDPFHFLQEAMAAYRGRCIGREGVNLIQRRLSALILAESYSTTRLGVAEQDLSSGKLIFTLIPGIIRSISFSAPDIDGSWKTAFPARPGDLLNVRDLEQGREQLKRITSRDVDMQLIPSAHPGESDIVIDVKRGKPWRLAVSLDDSGAKGTGKLQAGVNLAVDNPLGLNDLFHIGFNTDADRKGRQRGTTGNNLSYSVPYGYWTFGIAAGSYDYHQQIAGIYQTFISSGKGRNLEFKINKLFQRDQHQKNSVQFRVGKRWNHAYLDDTEIEVQRRNATYAELAWVHKHYFSAAQLDLSIANRWGVSWFNGDADLPGRQPDSPTTRYTLQTVDATLVAPFGIGAQPLTYIGTFRGQTTRSALYASEQFSIGNRYTVRGFDGELSLSAERGFFMRNEIELPLGDRPQSLYAGLDVGKVYGPAVQYLLGDKLAGAALGVRGAVQGLHYDLFLGWALYKPRNFRTAAPAAGFSLAYQY